MDGTTRFKGKQNETRSVKEKKKKDEGGPFPVKKDTVLEWKKKFFYYSYKKGFIRKGLSTHQQWALFLLGWEGQGATRRRELQRSHRHWNRTSVILEGEDRPISVRFRSVPIS